MQRSWAVGCLAILLVLGCDPEAPPEQPVDRTAPELSLTAPAASAQVGGTVDVRGLASDDQAVSLVEVQVDQGRFEPATGTTDWSYRWDTSTVSDGFHTLTVRATDSGGNLALAARTFVVSNARPERPIAMTLTFPMRDGVIGDTLRASATFTNTSTRVVQVPRLVLTARPPGASLPDGPAVDFEPVLGPLTLVPGQEVRLDAFARTRPLDPVGIWQVFPSYEDETRTVHIGPVQAIPLRRQVRLGAATNQGRLFDVNEPLYQQTFLAHFDSMTPEYEMKIAQLQPRFGEFEFANADRLVAFAEQHGKELRGHTLIWGNSLPAWLTGRTWTREELIEVLETYVATVVGRYRGRIPEWDVVNEAIDDQGRLRANLWRDTIGPEYIALAFRAAHRADPSARLFYNDFSAEKPNAKAAAIYELAVSLKAQGVPIDGIGMQAHVSPNYYPTQAELESVIARLEGAGLRADLTEMTVNLSQVSDMPEAEQLELQARIYKGMVAACQARRACTRVTAWGVTDKYNSLGSGSAPLLFDTRYAPKPALTVIRTILGR
ncbi:endo-1,4-beta-xylanase [Hyalangium gracile]|uniref:endo-1,4-beta-xylanase n=1 Tax=Hyalangium gracile TaxID=394092 RepID=UPI001CCF3185|nr:endo-1,4-beta-xylanase [Hyalangium gracile]